MAKHDINQPVLFILQRGRGGRGYLLSPLDDTSNPFPCADAQSVGDAALEILNDPNQARFDKSQIEDEDEDEDEGEEVEEAGEKDPYAGLEPHERLIFKAGEAIFGKAREMSNSYRHTGKKKKKVRKKKKK